MIIYSTCKRCKKREVEVHDPLDDNEYIGIYCSDCNGKERQESNYYHSGFTVMKHRKWIVLKSKSLLLSVPYVYYSMGEALMAEKWFKKRGYYLTTIHVTTNYIRF